VFDRVGVGGLYQEGEDHRQLTRAMCCISVRRPAYEAAPKQPGRRGASRRFISLARRCMSQLFAFAPAAAARDRRRRLGDRSRIYFLFLILI
jgi:hypothetical protein